MPIYEYKAFAPGGGIKSGVVDADTERDARLKLRRESLHVSRLVLVRGGRRGRDKVAAGKGGLLARVARQRSARHGPGARQSEIIAGTTRQLATLLGSGIALAEALKAIIDQAESRRVETMFREVREDIQQGLSLADALEKHPGWFSELYVNMVRAGQAAGNLDIVLSRLADYLQDQRALRRKITGAITYPILMISLGFLVVSILMALVVPRITSMLEDQGQTLPVPTQVLVEISDVFKEYWWVGALGIVKGIFWPAMLVYKLLEYLKM